MFTLRRSAAAAAIFVSTVLLATAAPAESASSTGLPLQVATAPTGSSDGALSAEVTRIFAPESPVRRFYEERGFAPLWLAASGAAMPAAQALLAWAGHADAQALPAERYGVEALAARLAAADRDAAGSAALEIDLTRLFLKFGRDVNSGLLEPRTLDENLDFAPHRPDPLGMLKAMALAADPAAYLKMLEPSDPGYAKLLATYADLRRVVQDGGWGPTVDAGTTLHPGDRDTRVAQLRARLARMGDMASADPDSTAQRDTVIAANDVVSDATRSAARAGDRNLFDPQLEAAVRRFQERHGLNVDGTVGRATLEALNTSAATRAMQVAVNLERMRWMNYQLGQRYVVINLAAFTMTMYEDGRVRFQTRAIVGQAHEHQTPEFVDELRYIVVNPVWNVPYSIATKEILPLLQENPDYLDENNMVLEGSDVPANEIDWHRVTIRTFPGHIKQLPGGENALGYVKFLFPNSHSVYMHDTPTRKLFARDRRDFSHGCVRLADPYDFAHLLLSMQDSHEDPVEAFDRLRAKEGEHWVTLDHPMPVYLTYRSAWVDDAGARQFRADVYHRDELVSQALIAAGVHIPG
jgi:murein L,D-transpeptidase YcbB/YkuD